MDKTELEQPCPAESEQNHKRPAPEELSIAPDAKRNKAIDGGPTVPDLSISTIAQRVPPPPQHLLSTKYVLTTLSSLRFWKNREAR